MECRITTLAENTVGNVFALGEHGFSALIETDDIKVLYDTGQGYAMVHNADVLKCDLKKVDKLVLSHNHFDHTAGMRAALKEIGKEIEVIAAPDLWSEKYSNRGRDNYMFIGIPFVRPELESLGARFTLTSEPHYLTDSILTSGEVAITTDFEKVGEDYLLVKKGDSYVPDDFADDRALFIKTSKGLVIVAGCAHRAIINTCLHARKITGIQQIDTVIGGIHLMDAGEERIKKTIEAFKELDIKHIGVSHCTGMKASAMMYHELGERFFFNNAGSRLEI